MIEFGATLRAARRASGMTQARLGLRADVSRPNVVAYEKERREPLFRNAMALLEAAGANVTIEGPVSWSWSGGLRPYAVPSRLWRLAPADALRSLQLGNHLWWSGPPRTLDLARRDERLRAYEIVLREGSPVDIEEAVDEVLLCEAWPDLVLPRELHDAWRDLVSPPVTSRRATAA
jgi:transcriptional regulator with XRE-family HTH domain